jgi:hypoxanthine phosphoribosyltransferase
MIAMVNQITLKHEAEQTLARAEQLYSRDDVEKAMDRMAVEISEVLHDRDPLVLCLMVGAVIVTGRLLTRLDFPLQLEYIHATRYQGGTRGGSITWQRKPEANVKDRTILVIDDILDEGITLRSIVDECSAAGAHEIYTAVLADKITGKARQFPQADFTGLTVPDRYVFGYGMDYKGYLRNCAGIYAVQD